MRINRLDLTRYGKFTDCRLDFGQPSPGEPDLHILYGPNEAGKSTALAAWLDLLYGIAPQSRYDFLHPYATMRIGAELEMGGAVLQVVRIKRPQGSLLDTSGAPLPETVLQAGLGGIDRAGYEAMFSLDDDTLAAGGDSILASRGELGQMLFVASAGLADLGASLEALRKEADSFHRPGGRKGGLADLKARLQEIDDRRRQIDTQAGDYARLAEAAALADADWQAVEAARLTTAAAAEGLRRTLAALPAYSRLGQVETALAGLGDMPVPPPDWPQTLPELAQDEAAARARLQEVEAGIDALLRLLASLNPDPAVCALAGQIAAAESQKSAHDEAVKDLPARQDEVTEAAQTIAVLMQRLGQPDLAPEAVLLPVTVTGRLRGLIEARSGIEARLNAARAEAGAAAAQSADAAARLVAVGGGTGDTEALALLLADLRARNPAQALALAERQHATTRQALAECLAALRPWQGEVVDLAAMAVPSDRQIKQWEQRLEAARRAQAEAGARRTGLDRDTARHEVVLTARLTSGRPGAEDVAAARGLRETLWAAHLQALTAGSAAAFEAAMRRDDQMTTQQAAAGAEATVQAQAREALALLRLELAGAETAQDAARAELDAVQAELEAAIAALSPALPASMAPADLRDWLALRGQALAALAVLESAGTGRCTALREVAAASAALRAALAATGLAADAAAPYALLAAQAQAQVDAGTRLAALREALAGASRNTDRRANDLAQAMAEDATWQTAWGAACAGSWLAEAGPPDVAAMRDILTTLDALDRAVVARDGLADRIAKMQANRAAFGQAVAALADVLALPAGDAGGLWPQITARLAAADAAEKARVQAEADLRDARAKAAELRAKADALAARITGMAGFFGVTGLTALRDCLSAAAKRTEMQASRDALAQDIRDALRQDDLAVALAQLSEIDRTALDHDLARLSALSDQQTHAAQQSFAALAEARRQLAAVGGDDAVARLDTARQTVLLETAEAARRHLRQRFGILAVDHALRAYRDSHRSAMMRRASDAFATISRGAYSGLAAQPDKDREVLVALARDGGSKLAQDLSKGTRFQLYLALRVAGYHEIAQTRRPVPFIADDIMETFDDDRSAEAFSLLAGMAMVGQVIYLTHHRHLCEIAKAVSPGVRVHDMGQQA
ncbi:MAG: AAA family ATPase [Pseudorhodobacter sp.]|nr:AAA family ATPase [Pseudorhodobacter sp.]